MFLRDKYYAKLLTQVTLHGQEDACVLVRELAQNLEGLSIKHSLRPQDDTSSTSSELPLQAGDNDSQKDATLNDANMFDDGSAPMF